MGNCCTTNINLQSIWFADFEKNLPALTGKRIAITGCTSGTGSVAALTCLKKGAEVFLLNRESKRAQDLLQTLQQACPGAAVHHIPCDLMDFSSVRAGAQLLQTACQGRLDVLCNNAGIMAVPDAASKDGYCVQMQTNHLSHFLLTKEMLPALRAAAKQNGEARIVNHSSEARKGGPLNAKHYEKIGGKIGGSDRYHQSKLANILFTLELADRLAGEHIKAIVCTPGFAVTNLLGPNPCLTRLGSCCIASCLAQSAEDGTMPLLTGIAGPDAKSGDLVMPSAGVGNEMKGPAKTHKRPLGPGNEVCQKKEDMERLWTLSERAIETEFKI